MEDNKIIPSNNDLPPDPLASEAINNKNTNNMKNKNNNGIINNINISNNNNDINIRKQIPYHFNPILLKYPMYQAYNNMMYLNYINQLRKNNINYINNLYMPYNNNQNSININGNQAKNNSNLNDLTININSEALIKLSKEFLIDIIMFIRDICKIKIQPKFAHLNHQIFKIKKERNKDNGYLFVINGDKINKVMSQKFKPLNEMDNIINDSDSSDNDDEKDNIINEQNNNDYNNNKNRINIQKNKYKIYDTFYCEVHNEVFINTDYKDHFTNHKKCEKCGAEFKNSKKLNKHVRKQHHDHIQNKNLNQNALIAIYCLIPLN